MTVLYRLVGDLSGETLMKRLRNNNDNDDDNGNDVIV